MQQHFAGINTARLAELTAGRPILITYADVIRRPGVWARELRPRLEAGAYPSVILDSGAFTELSERQRGVADPLHVDVHAYARFARDHADLFTFVTTLDDISGDLATTWRNTEILESYGVAAVPVFHGNEPWEVLHHYCQKYSNIGLGFHRELGRIARRQFDGLTTGEWLQKATAILEQYGVESHGFGMTHQAVRAGVELTTTDSTTFIAEACSLKRHADGGVFGLPALTRTRAFEITLLSYEAVKAAGRRISLPSVHGAHQARTVLQRFTPAGLAAFDLGIA